MMKRILLVEPDFPIPAKSKNHKNFLPIGLLKIATYLTQSGNDVRLVRGFPGSLDDMLTIQNFNPDEIWVTSLFTYWAKYVREGVHFYKSLFPKAKIKVGGIYASLFPKSKVKKYTGCDEVHQGIMPEAEKSFPAYHLIEDANPKPIDYQIIHASRGCNRKCPFCGTWKIEPKFNSKESIKEEIKARKLVFYDNNFLMNKNIERIIEELIELKRNKEILWCECQSGIDGRILLDKPHLARMMKMAGFRYPRIAWDWRYEEFRKIKSQLNILIKAGYHEKDIYVFMLYNWEIPFEEMEKKRIKCYDWKVQISDCRFRPLYQLYDNYNGNKVNQASDDYYIHPQWTDALVKQFRKNVRHQNICIRHGFPFYSKAFEHKRFDMEIMRHVKYIEDKRKKAKFLKNHDIDFWFPNHTRKPL